MTQSQHAIAESIPATPMSPLPDEAVNAAPQAVRFGTATGSARRFAPTRPSVGRERPGTRPSAGDPSDEVLMQRVAGGDAGAFALIYDRHAGAALGLARRMLHQQGAAEDVVQEAFLALWRSGTYRAARGSVRGFLLRIVHNAAVDLLRRERSRGAGRHVAETFAHPLAAEDDVHREVERTEAAARVRDAMAALPAPQRHSLELAYFGGLTNVEIALAVGVPIGTVKSRLRLGLEKLRQQDAVACCA